MENQTGAEASGANVEATASDMQQLSLNDMNELFGGGDMSSLGEQFGAMSMVSDDKQDGGLQKPTDPKEARKISIQRCIQSLVHACRCTDAACSLSSCLKMKRVVGHTKACKRKTNGGCPICKQFVALCCYHAKHCQETKCQVPYCSHIKCKLGRCYLKRLQQARLVKSTNPKHKRPMELPVPRWNQGLTARGQAVQKLFQMLENAHKLGQQYKVLQAANPSINAAFMKKQPVANQHVFYELVEDKTTLMKRTFFLERRTFNVSGFPSQFPAQPIVTNPTMTFGPVVQNDVSALNQITEILNAPPTPEEKYQSTQILKSCPPLQAALLKYQELAARESDHQVPQHPAGPNATIDTDEVTLVTPKEERSE